jgi:hypothetical protein
MRQLRIFRNVRSANRTAHVACGSRADVLTARKSRPQHFNNRKFASSSGHMLRPGETNLLARSAFPRERVRSFEDRTRKPTTGSARLCRDLIGGYPQSFFLASKSAEHNMRSFVTPSGDERNRSTPAVRPKGRSATPPGRPFVYWLTGLHDAPAWPTLNCGYDGAAPRIAESCQIPTLSALGGAF